MLNKLGRVLEEVVVAWLAGERPTIFTINLGEGE